MIKLQSVNWQIRSESCWEPYATDDQDRHIRIRSLLQKLKKCSFTLELKRNEGDRTEKKVNVVYIWDPCPLNASALNFLSEVGRRLTS